VTDVVNQQASGPAADGPDADAAIGGAPPWDVLLLDASTRQALAAVRSLGRAGLRVGLAECYADCRPGLPILAFRSRHCAGTVILPSFATSPTEYAAAVLDAVRAHRPRVLVPGNDGSLTAVLPYRGVLAELGCTLAVAPDAPLAVANDKERTLALAARLGIAHPRTAVVTGPADLADVLDTFAFPVVLKPRTSWAPRAGVRLAPTEAVDRAEAMASAGRILASGSSVLVQEWIGGRREGVTVFASGGQVLARFAHVEHRTTPALGGASVVRESIPVPADLASAADRLVTELGLDGLSGVEFRRNAQGRPFLMEINARLAGPTEIALRAGVDFPRLLWCWAAGEPLEPQAGYRVGLRMRWLRGDMRWLRDNRRRAGRPDSVGRAAAALTFATEFLRTPRLDAYDPRDLAPLLAELRVTAHSVLHQKTAATPAAVPTRKETPVTATDAVVIGAGPFGLSISAHLRERGIEHTLVGRPMQTWREHMPAGMHLRSEPYGSDLAAPRRGWDVRAYSRQHGLDYVHRLGPLPMERLLDYTDWYVDRWVPETLDDRVTDVTATGDGFRVTFADSRSMTARTVVAATGLLPFRVLPEQFAGLPAELVTHTSDHHRLDRFAGRRVAVVGGGQSALETAALLHEAGADVRVVARRAALNWLEPNPAHVSLLGHLGRPVNKLCEGWRCQFYDTPAAFRRLPQRIAVEKARGVLGPAGAWWLKDRVAGVVEVLTGHRVRAASAHGTGVRLQLEGGECSTLDVDHVICGTGFRLDLSLGPSTRFIAGTHPTVRPPDRGRPTGHRHRRGADPKGPAPRPVTS